MENASKKSTAIKILLALGLIFLLVGIVAYVYADNNAREADERYSELLELRQQFSNYMHKAEDNYLRTGDPYWLGVFTDAQSNYLQTFETEAINDIVIQSGYHIRVIAIFIMATGLIILAVGICY